MNDAPQEYGDRGDLERRVEETPSRKPIQVFESPPDVGLDVVCMADVKPTSIECRGHTRP